MKAISLWQPWASAIPAGLKSIETRGWATAYRGPLAIHAAKRDTPEEREFWEDMTDGERAAFARLGVLSYADLPRGAIVATCELIDCRPADKCGVRMLADSPEYWWGNYEAGRFGWLLANVTPLPVPMPCVGRQGFFEWPNT